LDDAPPAELGVPWIQFGDGTVNLDCTDAELETLKTVIGEFSAFKIDELIRPEEAGGVNARISAKADPNRIAQFVDEVFLEVCMIYRQGFASGSPRCERPSVATETIHTLIGQLSVDQACNDLQWLL